MNHWQNVRRRTGTMTSGGFHTSIAAKKELPATHFAGARGTYPRAGAFRASWWTRFTAGGVFLHLNQDVRLPVPAENGEFRRDQDLGSILFFFSTTQLHAHFVKIKKQNLELTFNELSCTAARSTRQVNTKKKNPEIKCVPFCNLIPFLHSTYMYIKNIKLTQRRQEPCRFVDISLPIKK